MLSGLVLSRLQFAITISFHILFPAFSIGLATYIACCEGLWLKTQREVYYRSCRFFSKILALTFGMGIISGLAMEFQLGTNWSGFSAQLGPVLGVLFVAEAFSAFFIEATFLGLMLFGWQRLNPKFHYFCTLMVCLGVTISAFWIMAANSWMQTPAGITFSNHQFTVTSWFNVIFNPSTLLRFIHMLLASYVATANIICAIAAYYLLRTRETNFALTNIRLALLSLIICLPLQIIVGDLVGLKVHHYQPVKTAAIEGLWHTRRGAPLVLAAHIDQQQQQNRFALTIPHLASLINTHHWNGELKGLDQVPITAQPRVALVFYSFRIMVGLGFLMLILSALLLYNYNKDTLLQRKRLLQLSTWLAPAGMIAMLCGWYTAECGRQPWIVYGLITTREAVSAVPMIKVLLGFLIICFVYGILFLGCYGLYFRRLITQGPSHYALPKFNKSKTLRIIKLRSRYAHY